MTERMGETAQYGRRRPGRPFSLVFLGSAGEGASRAWSDPPDPPNPSDPRIPSRRPASPSGAARAANPAAAIRAYRNHR